MTHNIPRPVYTYLCHNHFNSLPGIAVHDEVDSGKCIVCGHKAEVAVRSVTIFGEVLNRIAVLYFNEVQREYEGRSGYTLAKDKIEGYNQVDKKYKITKDGVQEISLEEYHNELKNGGWEFDEDYVYFCGQCHFPLTLVRPGKYQCETPWCPSNQKEETK